MRIEFVEVLLNTIAGVGTTASGCTIIVAEEDFWLLQGLSERADVTGECFVTSFPRVYIYFVPRASFCVPFGNWKLETSQLPAYVAELSIERLGLDQWLYIVSIIYNFICK